MFTDNLFWKPLEQQIMKVESRFKQPLKWS